MLRISRLLGRTYYAVAIICILGFVFNLPAYGQVSEASPITQVPAQPLNPPPPPAPPATLESPTAAATPTPAQAAEPTQSDQRSQIPVRPAQPVFPGQAGRPIARPGTTPAPTSPIPAPPPPTQRGARPVASPTPDTIRLQFANTDVTDILDNYYAKLTGKRVIYDPTVQGKLTIFINTPVDREEAIKILETQLMLSGFPIIKGEGDILKVVSGTKNARTTGPPIYSELSQLPEGEQVVSFLMKPKYLDIPELQQALSLYIPIQNQYTSFIALPKSGAILATENSDTIRRIVRMVQQLDVPPATVIDRFISLERADATKAVDFVNTVLHKEKAPQTATVGPGGIAGAAPTSPSARRPFRPNPAENFADGTNVVVAGSLASAIAALSEGSLVTGDVTLTADIRTNRVHVVARPADFPFIERLIVQFDANAPFATPFKRALRWIKANDVLPILVQALTEPGMENQNQTQAGVAGAQASPSPSPTTTGGRSGTFGGGLSTGTGTTPSDSGGNLANLGQSQLDTPEVDTRPQSAIVGTTRLIADQRVNSIIIMAGADARQKVIEVLDELDVPTQQVLIEAVIGQLQLTNNEAFGLDYIFTNARNVATTNYQRAPIASVTTLQGVTNPETGTVASSYLSNNFIQATQIAASAFNASVPGFAGVISPIHNINIIVNALLQTKRFKTLSRPVVFTSNNKRAIIASGQEVPIPENINSSVVNGTTTNTVGSVTSSVTYKDVTLQLEVVPLINTDNDVSLDIFQKIDSLVPDGTVIIAGSAVPTISTRRVRSNVQVPNHGTVVLGGLIDQQQSKTKTMVPILGKIPFLGELFKNRTNDQFRNELIILMSPTVSNNPCDTADITELEEDMLYLEPDIHGQLKAIRRAEPVIHGGDLIIAPKTRFSPRERFCPPRIAPFPLEK